MISRFFTRWLMIWLFILLMWKINDITPSLSSVAKFHQSKDSFTIIPVTITASRRDYPSVIENRGKWFIYNNTLYTAWHVIADTGYNYFIDWSVPIILLYHLSWDIWSATYSWTINQWNRLNHNSGSSNDQVLMWQNRNTIRSRLTWSIISLSGQWIIINLPVLYGDSGSPVMFADQTIGIISKSHNWNQAIVQMIQ